jgi:hypothetical protein
MRQKLPHPSSPSDTHTHSQPPSFSSGPVTSEPESRSVASNISSSANDQSRKAPAQLAERGLSLDASDHELSRAVFGGGNSVTGPSGTISSDVTRPLSAPLSPYASGIGNGKGGDNAPVADAKESGLGGVPLSLLEFRKLIAGGLPNPATRVFVVTGRGLAGAIRVTQITQVS